MVVAPVAPPLAMVPVEVLAVEGVMVPLRAGLGIPHLPTHRKAMRVETAAKAALLLVPVVVAEPELWVGMASAALPEEAVRGELVLHRLLQGHLLLMRGVAVVGYFLLLLQLLLVGQVVAVTEEKVALARNQEGQTLEAVEVGQESQEAQEAQEGLA